jgi:hypothetical protein
MRHLNENVPLRAWLLAVLATTSAWAGKAANDLSVDGSAGGCGAGLLLCQVTTFNDAAQTTSTVSQCFDPTAYFCALREDGVDPGHLLCPVAAPQLCGYQCFDPTKFTCIVHEALCPTTAPLLCGSDCYNAGAYDCKNGRLVQFVQTDQIDMFQGLTATLPPGGCGSLATCVTTEPFTTRFEDDSS